MRTILRTVMVTVLVTVLAVFCFALSGVPAAYAYTQTESIAAVVNDNAVSASDVAQRMTLMIISSGLPNNAEIRERMKPQIVNMLIDEQIKMQEATRLGITVDRQEIDQGIQSIARQNKISVEQFSAAMERDGISLKALEDQIKAQIAWSHVIQKRIHPQVDITDHEIDAAIDRMKASAGKARYLASEIFLPVESPHEEANVKKLADRLTRQLTKGNVPFQKLAGQFSQAAGASRGGDMGWVQEGDLPEALDDMLTRMKEGELSRPVRSLSGYHILYLRKKSTISEDSIPSREEIMNRLGLEQMERLQRRYFLDLKAVSFIENRV